MGEEAFAQTAFLRQDFHMGLAPTVSHCHTTVPQGLEQPSNSGKKQHSISAVPPHVPLRQIGGNRSAIELLELWENLAPESRQTLLAVARGLASTTTRKALK